MDFNKIKEIIISLARKNGVDPSTLQNEVDLETNTLSWCIDWKEDLNDLFRKDVDRLQIALNIYSKATSKGDMLTAQASLIRVKIQLQNLEGFFCALRRDIAKTYSDERFNWPEFPDGKWKIPSEYGIKD